MQADAAYMTQRIGSERAVRECCLNMLGAVQCLVLATAGMSVDDTSGRILEGKNMFVTRAAYD